MASILLSKRRSGFEAVSKQHPTHAQQRSYSIHGLSLSLASKSSKRKKGSAGRVTLPSHLDKLFCAL